MGLGQLSLRGSLQESNMACPKSIASMSCIQYIYIYISIHIHTYVYIYIYMYIYIYIMPLLKLKGFHCNVCHAYHDIPTIETGVHGLNPWNQRGSHSWRFNQFNPHVSWLKPIWDRSSQNRQWKISGISCELCEASEFGQPWSRQAMLQTCGYSDHFLGSSRGTFEFERSGEIETQ